MQLAKSATYYPYVMELHHLRVCTAGKNGTLLHAFWEFMDVF